MKYLANLALVISILIVYGCSSSPKIIREKKKAETYPLVYPKIKGAHVVLELVSPRREFYAGEDVELTFRLKNVGEKGLVLYEWMAEESNNLNIYFTIHKKSMKYLKLDEWNSDVFTPDKHTRRLPLSIRRGNSILIKKKIGFIKKINPGKLPEGGVEFLILGELNLKSLKAKSQVVSIKVK